MKRGGLQRVPVVEGASLLAICDLMVVLARRLTVGLAGRDEQIPFGNDNKVWGAVVMVSPEGPPPPWGAGG